MKSANNMGKLALRPSRVVLASLTRVAVGSTIMIALLTGVEVHAKDASKRDMFAHKVEALASSPLLARSQLGISVVDISNGRVVFARNADRLFRPASTEKLFTEGAALTLLGPDFRFRTIVRADGPVRDGVVDGDLELVGSGDPNLSGRVDGPDHLRFLARDGVGAPNDGPAGDAVLRELAREVAKRGIKRIRGDVVANVDLFPQGAVERGSNSVISPIVVNDNKIDVSVSAGESSGKPAIISVFPSTDRVKVRSSIVTGPDGSPRTVGLYSDTEPGGIVVLVASGSIARDGKPVNVSYPIPDPQVFAAQAFRTALLASGIIIEGTRRDAQAVSTTIVAEHVSPPLSEDVAATLKASLNLHAAMMPYVLGVYPKPGRGFARADGFARIRDFLQGGGLDMSQVMMEDGAGSDGAAAVTPAFMTSYLTMMSKGKLFAIFRGALPLLARDGTLYNIGASSPAAGHVSAKTGTTLYVDSLNSRYVVDAKTLAGYVETKHGRIYAFAVFASEIPLLKPDETHTLSESLAQIAALLYEN